MKRLLPLLAVTLLAGCFVTTLSLGKPESARVDPLFCGDWRLESEDADAKRAELIIRNFDGKQYYAEWKTPEDKPARMRGFLVKIKDATFAQCAELTDTAELSSKHLIVRVSIKEGSLTVRHLKEEFFNGVDTDEALRKK